MTDEPLTLTPPLEPPTFSRCKACGQFGGEDTLLALYDEQGRLVDGQLRCAACLRGRGRRVVAAAGQLRLRLDEEKGRRG